MKLNFRAGIIIDENLIFSCKDFNGLFKYNLESSEITYLGVFEGDSFLEWKHCANPVCCDNKVYFIPGNDNKLIEYNLSRNSKKEYGLPIDVYLGSEGYIEESKLYLFSDKYESGFWVYDLSNKTISPEIEMYSSLKKIVAENDLITVCMNDGVLVAAVRKTNKYMSYNLKTKEKKLYVIEKLEGIHQVYYYKDFYYVTLEDSYDILKCQGGEIVKRYELTNQQWTGKKNIPYGKIVSNEDKLVFVNYSTKYVVLLDADNDSVEVLEDSYVEGCDVQNGSAICYREKFYIFPENTGIMLEIDNKKIIKHQINIGIKELGTKRMLELESRGKVVRIYENAETSTIRNFIEYLL